MVGQTSKGFLIYNLFNGGVCNYKALQQFLHVDDVLYKKIDTFKK